MQSDEPTQIQNAAEAEKAVAKHARLTVLFTLACAEQSKALREVMEKHGPLIAGLSKQISEVTEQLEGWATANRRSAFGERQSCEFPNGTLKFRHGNEKLDLYYGWTWDKSLEKVLEFGPSSQWNEFVRREPSLNLQKILAQAKGKEALLSAARLKMIGLKVVRGEKFSIEPKPVV